MIHVLTVAHPRFDTRIWTKEIQSLVKAGYEVKYHVADGAGNETLNEVEIIDYGSVPAGCGLSFRLKRMFHVMTQSGLKRGDWVHFHDGVFLPFALFLALKGCKVVYDVHEDFPRQILNTRFPYWMKRIWSSCLSFMEWCSRFLFRGYIAATPKIAGRFPQSKTITVQNYPILSELSQTDSVKHGSFKYVIYVGGISEVRGIREIIQATGLSAEKIPEVRLALAGTYSPASLKESLLSLSGWQYVEELGWLSRQDVKYWLSQSSVGLVTLHPTKNYPDAYPVKMFEYMSAGLPVVASDFPLWRNIVEESGCGLLVNPMKPEEIAEAINRIMSNPEEAHRMGRSGKKAVESKYNWQIEENKLLSFYHSEFGNESPS